MAATKEIQDVLTVTLREKGGTTASNAVRREGGIPAVLYGHGDPTPITIDHKAFSDLLHAGAKNHLLSISLGGRTETAIVRDIQRDPVSRRIVSADLQRVGATEEITSTVPLVTVGVSPAVKNEGAVMDIVVHEVTISGPANAVPEHLEVDVSNLGLHGHITAGDLKLPAKFKLGVDAATILISIEASRTATDVAEAAEAEAPAATEEPGEAEAPAEAPAEG